MRILAIDATTEKCSVAICRENQVFIRESLVPQKHTEHILPMIAELLDEVSLSLTDLDAIACTRGPGSFTGVRVTLGITQGLAFGSLLPVIPISTLQVLAQGTIIKTDATHILTLLDARMGEYYFAVFEYKDADQWQMTLSESVINSENLLIYLHELSGRWHYAGNGWALDPLIMSLINQKELIDAEYYLPTASAMLPLAKKLFAEGKQLPVEAIKPIYLRDQVVQTITK